MVKQGNIKSKLSDLTRFIMGEVSLQDMGEPESQVFNVLRDGDKHYVDGKLYTLDEYNAFKDLHPGAILFMSDAQVIREARAANEAMKAEHALCFKSTHRNTYADAEEAFLECTTIKVIEPICRG